MWVCTHVRVYAQKSMTGRKLRAHGNRINDNFVFSGGCVWASVSVRKSNDVKMRLCTYGCTMVFSVVEAELRVEFNEFSSSGIILVVLY